jgi:hypothetical protein
MTIFYWKIILKSMRIKIKHFSLVNTTNKKYILKPNHLAGKVKEQRNFTPFPLSEAKHFLH